MPIRIIHLPIRIILSQKTLHFTIVCTQVAAETNRWTWWVECADLMAWWGQVPYIYIPTLFINSLNEHQRKDVASARFRIAPLGRNVGPNDVLWRQWYGSTLAQALACCLTAPSFYLNQCWLIISKVDWHSSMGKFTRDNSATNHWNSMEIKYLKKKYLKFHSNFPGANELAELAAEIIHTKFLFYSRG